jgi:integrase
MRVEAGDRSGNSLREIVRWTTPGRYGYLCWWHGASLFSVDFDSVEEWDLWMSGQGIGAKTRRNVMAALHSFCVWARRRRPTFEIPDFPWPEADEHVPRIVSMKVQAAILDAIPEPKRGLYLALAYLGIRPGEGVVARIEDWRGDELRIIRGKKDRKVLGQEGGTKKKRGGKRLPIPAELAAWLDKNVPAERRLAEPAAYLFQNPAARNAAGQWSEAAMRRTWYAACDKVGVQVSLYEGTKHSFGTAAKAAGIEDRVLAQVFGHADPRSVSRYAKLEPEVIRVNLERIRRR